ncbi:MAG: VC0807 family protein [Actinomycetes bacterium]
METSERTESPAPDALAEIRTEVASGDARGASRSLLKSVGPRLLRDILGPTLLFYAGWKLTDNIFMGIALGSGFALGAYYYERRHGRPGVIARFVLAFVVIQAVVGLATGSATAYLIQPAILGAINGTIWLGSVAIGRPLAALFAHEVFPFDAETRASPEFRAVFRHVSLAFGIFFLFFAVVQAVVLLIVGVGAFVAVRVVDVVCTLGMVVYCLRYMVRRIDFSKLRS